MALTSNEIRFASHHDWFIEDNGNGSVTVLDTWTETDKKTGLVSGGSQRLVFDNFNKLYVWAGY